MPRTHAQLQAAIETALAAELSAPDTPGPSPQDDGDVLIGSKAIAAHLFKNEKRGKTVYKLAQRGLIPVFYWGGLLCSRKSSLNRTITARERATLTAIREIATAAE